MALHPVILAGGSGTRLWPLSREYHPKQFLNLTGNRSLFQDTLCRLDGVEKVSAPTIVCNEAHRFLVAEHTRQIGKTPFAIILESEGRNTAPALALAALMLSDASPDLEDPVMLIMPSDHIIRNLTTFQSAVQRGFALAKIGCLVTFGIVPTSPKTGFGYIKKGEAVRQPPLEARKSDNKRLSPRTTPFSVAGFIEKPDEATAKTMLESEDYLWNSGIFMMKVSVWLDQLERHRSDIAEICRSAHAHGRKDGTFYRPDANLFATCPSDSIDYSVMEKIANGLKDGQSDSASLPLAVVLRLDSGWTDVGAWSALWEENKRDTNGNVIQGDVYSHRMRNSLLIGHHRMVATVGLDNIVVVETADAVLVAHKDHVEDVRELVGKLEQEGRPERENHRKVHQPWGSYETVDTGPRFKVKRLTVNPGEALSLQLHNHRAEHWVVVKGTAKVTRGDDEFLLTENQSAYVSVGTRHRLENPGDITLEIIEVQSGSYLGEDDILRFEDRYNRHES